MLCTFILLSCAPEYLLRLPAPQVLARVVAKLPACEAAQVQLVSR